MKATMIHGAAITALIAGVGGCGVGEAQTSAYQRDFGVAKCPMVTTGRNTYMVLEPGHRLVLEGDGIKLHITVLDETKSVAGVTTRVVEEREWKDGELHEIARNYFAMCESTKDIFYFGEDVAYYEKGKVVKNEGSWLAGVKGGKPGLYMPGTPKLGMKYYQEIAPGVAMDRAEIVSVSETCTTPAGTFSHCLKIKETTPLDPLVTEYKFYAPGIGLVQDDKVLLKEYGPAAAK